MPANQWGEVVPSRLSRLASVAAVALADVAVESVLVKQLVRACSVAVRATDASFATVPHFVTGSNPHAPQPEPMRRLMGWGQASDRDAAGFLA
jgi:hypothetical protein